MSDEEAEINEKQSECDNSINIENKPIKDKNNSEFEDENDSEINMEDEDNKDFINNKDYSQIVIDVK